MVLYEYNSGHNPYSARNHVVTDPGQTIPSAIPSLLNPGSLFSAQSCCHWSRADNSARNPVVNDPGRLFRAQSPWQNIPRVIRSSLSLLTTPTSTIANCTPHGWLDTWQSAKSLNGLTSPNHKNNYKIRTFKGKFRWNKRFRLCLPQQKQNKKCDISVLKSHEITSDKMTITN